jgi:hypothetical protein
MFAVGWVWQLEVRRTCKDVVALEDRRQRQARTMLSRQEI